QKVTAVDGKTVTQDLTSEVLPMFALDAVNSAWKFWKGPTVEGKIPTPYDPAIVSDPNFKDTDWVDQDPTMRSNADTATGALIPGNYWLRGTFKLGAAGIPADFSVDRAAVMYNFDVDSRSLGIWVNGVPIGAAPAGDTPASNVFLIPGGVLK